MAQSRWTFFYYCNAESDLFDNVVTMVQNMGKLEFPEEHQVNILLLVDRIQLKDTMEVMRFYRDQKYRWHDAIRFVVRPGIDATRAHAEKELGEVDMGDPDVFRSFIRWGRKAFPADHYGLIIYGHGSGVSVGNMMEYRKPENVAANMLLSAIAASEPIEDRKNFCGAIGHAGLTELFPVNDDTLEGIASTPLPQNNTVAHFASLLQTTIDDNTAEGGAELNNILESIKENVLMDTIMGNLSEESSTHKFNGRNSDLYIYELSKALKTLKFKPDLLLFDSCFMMTFETAIEFKDTAAFLLGSQGFNSRAPMGNQSFLQHVLNNSKIEPRQLALHIVNNITDRLEIESPEAPTVFNEPHVSPRTPDFFRKVYCYSCIDLGKMSAFNKSLDTLVDLLMNPHDVRIEEWVNKALEEIIPFYQVSCPDQFYIGTIDLLFFLQCLEAKSKDSLLTAKVRNCIHLLNDAILASNVGEEMTITSRPAYNPKGLSIFFPSDRSIILEGATLMNTYWYSKKRKLLALSKKSLWDDYILSRIYDWY